MAPELGGSPPQYSLSPSPAHKRKSGSDVFHETRSPLHGRVRQRNDDKWVGVAGGREPKNKSRVWRRSFAATEMAANAHDAAAASGSRRGKSSSAGNMGTASPSSSSRTSHDTACGADSTQLEGPNRFLGVSWEDCEGSGSTAVFVDEEAVFNTPGLIHSMAEGLLLAPPTMLEGFSLDDSVYYTDLSLWNDDL